MSRPKIISQLKEKNPKLSKSELEIIIDVFSDCITKALKLGKSVEIRGFGRFTTKKLKENFNLRNPATNELIYKPERVKIKFKPSKNLKKKINE